MIVSDSKFVNATTAGKTLSVAPSIDNSAKITACELGRYTEVGARTKLLETTLGDYSYVVNDSDIAYSRVGKFTSIAAHVRINPGDHPMHRASQSHFTYRASAYFEGEDDDAAFFDWRRSRCVEIGHDVWIGHGVVVLSRRKIGTGAVIGAGSVVTKDVPPYAVVAGNPARLIRMRFTDEVAAGLQSIAWWDWPHERLRAGLANFRCMEAVDFVQKYRPNS